LLLITHLAFQKFSAKICQQQTNIQQSQTDKVTTNSGRGNTISNTTKHISGIHSYTGITTVYVNLTLRTSPISHCFNGHFPGGRGLAGTSQNVSILEFIGAEDDGGGGNNCSYKMCKAPVKSSPPTNQ